MTIRLLPRGRKGQFIPMAAMVMLSVTVFMVGVVNVYRISRAKLKAQNLADAVALYIASQMTQSMNQVADRNEWMNILYSNPNDPNATSASSDPCVVPPNSPPGLGCFASGRATYVFSGMQAVQSYAQLVQTINQIQNLFSQSYNTLLGTQPGAVNSNGQSSLQANLLRNIPALNDPAVQLVVFNSQQTKGYATNEATQMSQHANTSGQPNLQVNNLAPVQFAVTKPVYVKYSAPTLIPGVYHTETTPLTLGGSLVGGMDFQPGTASLDGTSPQNLNTSTAMGAGAIVTLAVTLMGLSATQVQAQSIAYVVSTAGNVAYDTQGRASPTYWVKLGKPI